MYVNRKSSGSRVKNCNEWNDTTAFLPQKNMLQTTPKKGILRGDHHCDSKDHTHHYYGTPIAISWGRGWAAREKKLCVCVFPKKGYHEKILLSATRIPCCKQLNWNTQKEKGEIVVSFFPFYFFHSLDVHDLISSQIPTSIQGFYRNPIFFLAKEKNGQASLV